MPLFVNLISIRTKVHILSALLVLISAYNDRVDQADIVTQQHNIDEHQWYPQKWTHTRHRRKMGRHIPYHDDNTHAPPYTISNLSCSFFTQPLNHFALPKNSSSSYQQRFCYFDGFVHHAQNENENRKSTPVFLYVGNESPIETYINHTGLMWELAPQFQALVVFLEHRYEGQSIPNVQSTMKPNGNGCMAYSSSIQALADAAYFIQRMIQTPSSILSTSMGDVNSTYTTFQQRHPVIAFGGSYGGMLSAWLRMIYPSVVTGAIAASAPIWGFPRTLIPIENRVKNSTVIDLASQVITYGLYQTYPPTPTINILNTTGNDKKEIVHDDDNKPVLNHSTSESFFVDTNHCPTNLLAAWPLMQVLGQSSVGREWLFEAFYLCHPLPNATSNTSQPLIAWAQSPWFDLSEGSYPYPSSYISYALTHKANVQLPAWPLQSACWKNSTLYRDYGIVFDGDPSNVKYSISYGDSNLLLTVDWDTVTETIPSNIQSFNEFLQNIQEKESQNTIMTLLTNVRDAVSVWYNASLDVKCFDIDDVAPNTKAYMSNVINERNEKRSEIAMTRRMLSIDTHHNASSQCREKIKLEGSWPSLCCNEEMNLIISDASGLGNDIFWPPSVPRHTLTYAQLLHISNVTDSLEPCSDPDGIFGYPQHDIDPWSTWYDTVFGGRHTLHSLSNIIFSNGRLDPWSAAGVYNPQIHGVSTSEKPNNKYTNIPGLVVENITDTVLSVVMDLGGHHTDLMYSNNKSDPLCVQHARLVERDMIAQWIDNFWVAQ